MATNKTPIRVELKSAPAKPRESKPAPATPHVAYKMLPPADDNEFFGTAANFHKLFKQLKQTDPEG